MLSVAYPMPLPVAYPTFTNDIRRLSDGIAVALPTAKQFHHRQRYAVA